MNRNQVIPMIINERTTLDIILDQIEYYLKQNNTNPNINLEIEGKLGFFKLKQICKEDQLKFLEIVSENNYILLDKTFFETNFESGVNYQVFHNNLDYFRRVYKQSKRVGNENFNENDGLKEYFFNIANYGEIREGISVDYVQKGKNGNKKQRATYEIGHGISYMEKNNKIHLNILHNKKHYRVSVNSEEKKPLPTDFFSNLSSIRVKHRTIFPFQFFEFHFTEVITLPPNNNVIESPTESPEFDIKLINLFSQENVQKTYEIELEIINITYLRNNLAQREIFKSVFCRFLRNLETLYQGGEYLYEPNYNKFINGNQKFCPKPVCGDYMMKEACRKKKG